VGGIERKVRYGRHTRAIPDIQVHARGRDPGIREVAHKAPGILLRCLELLLHLKHLLLKLVGLDLVLVSRVCHLAQRRLHIGCSGVTQMKQSRAHISSSVTSRVSVRVVCITLFCHVYLVSIAP